MDLFFTIGPWVLVNNVDYDTSIYLGYYDYMKSKKKKTFTQDAFAPPPTYLDIILWLFMIVIYFLFF